MEKSAEIVLIPFSLKGHLPAALEFAKLVVSRDDRLSVTVLIVSLPLDPGGEYADSLLASFPPSQRIKFARITNDSFSAGDTMDSFDYMSQIIESLKLPIKNHVNKMVRDEGTRLAGFVFDSVLMPMADVADELGIASYVFWTCSAGFLGLSLHLLQILDHNKNIIEECGEFKRLDIPGSGNRVPAHAIPAILLDNASAIAVFQDNLSRLRKAKGVVLNTSVEIEPHIISSFIASDGQSPPVYPVGPLLNLTSMASGSYAFSGVVDGANSMEWLDIQPPASVVLLCFGSIGCLSPDQVKEIALALERTGFRFVWSLRVSPPTKDPLSTLPDGFLDRTAGVGQVVSWIPQADILAHPAVGGFVSHCGWNSLMESLWFGVPVAAWPLYAEQHFNAFQLVTEMGLAVEVKLDDTTGVDGVVRAEAIEAAMRSVIEGESEVRKRVKEASKKCREAVAEGGSSLSSSDGFVSDVFKNLQLID